MNDEVKKISKEDLEMNINLFELKGSKHWLAIKRYIMLVCMKADEITSFVDPFKDPSNICKNQGIKYGLKSFESYIDTLEDPEASIDDDDKQ